MKNDALAIETGTVHSEGPESWRRGASATGARISRNSGRDLDRNYLAMRLRLDSNASWRQTVRGPPSGLDPCCPPCCSSSLRPHTASSWSRYRTSSSS